ncbi:MAG: hypothetical protein AAGF77_10535, partial [Bacteroidota bacterium]
KGFAKRCIDLEYTLRPKIIKFLMERFEQECCGDFSCFYFDVEVNTGIIKMASKTPLHYRMIAQKDFDQRINGSSPRRYMAS